MRALARVRQTARLLDRLPGWERAYADDVCGDTETQCQGLREIAEPCAITTAPKLLSYLSNSAAIWLLQSAEALNRARTCFGSRSNPSLCDTTYNGRRFTSAWMRPI
jgi:hypothetical protein